MRLYLDEDVNVIYLRLDDAPVVRSEEVRPGVVLDFDEHGALVGIEVRRAALPGQSQDTSSTQTPSHVSRTDLGADLRALRDRLHRSGVPPLTWDEIDREIAERRGEPPVQRAG